LKQILLHGVLLKIHAKTVGNCKFVPMTLDTLRQHLKAGEVYRRSDLQEWSTSVDRHLQQLVKDGTLEKLASGLYYVPKQGVFGKVPADEHELIKAFLKDDRFVVTSASDYNALGVGTTQLYNDRRVYNQKRHGTFKFGNRTFRFVRKPFVPNKLSKEFLLVDLVNNIDRLEEDQSKLLANIQRKAKEMDRKKLMRLVQDFGTLSTKKKFLYLFSIH